MSEELKPCPFCGSEDLIVLKKRNTPKWMQCANCLSSTGTYNTVEEVIEAWNRRVSDED